MCYTAVQLSLADSLVSVHPPQESLHNSLQTESHVKRAENTRCPQKPLTCHNRCLLETDTSVVDKVLDAIDEVENEREAEEELHTSVDDPWHGSECGRKARALEVPSQKRGGEVAGEVEVGAAGEEAAGDTGPCGGAEPRLGELVDAEMGGDGTVETLVDENLVAFVLGDLCRCDGAARGC